MTLNSIYKGTGNETGDDTGLAGRTGAAGTGSILYSIKWRGRRRGTRYYPKSYSVSEPDILTFAQGMFSPLSESRVCRLFRCVLYSRPFLLFFFQDGNSYWQTEANYKIVAPLLKLPCDIYILVMISAFFKTKIV